jgi:hypothetical protein
MGLGAVPVNKASIAYLKVVDLSSLHWLIRKYYVYPMDGVSLEWTREAIRLVPQPFPMAADSDITAKTQIENLNVRFRDHPTTVEFLKWHSNPLILPRTL